jgi:hypothetical protein
LKQNPQNKLDQKIQLGLKEKNSGKIIPFWLKYTGIAAAFLFESLYQHTLYNTNTTSDKKNCN